MNVTALHGTDAVRNLNIWRLMACHLPEHYDEVVSCARRSGTIGVGWGGVGDLNLCRPHDELELTSLIERSHRQSTGPSNWVNGGRSLWRIYHEMRSHGLQELVFQSSGTSVKVVLYTQPIEANQVLPSNIAPPIVQIQRRLGGQKVAALLTSFASRTSITTKEVTELIGMSVPTARRYLSELERFGIVAEDRTSKNDPRAVWRKTQSEFWAPGELERTLKSLL